MRAAVFVCGTSAAAHACCLWDDEHRCTRRPRQARASRSSRRLIPSSLPTNRLYIEARGEEDLRDPAESSCGFLVHRGPPPDRAALQRRLAELQARRALTGGAALVQGPACCRTGGNRQAAAAAAQACPALCPSPRAQAPAAGVRGGGGRGGGRPGRHPAAAPLAGAQRHAAGADGAWAGAVMSRGLVVCTCASRQGGSLPPALAFQSFLPSCLSLFFPSRSWSCPRKWSSPLQTC